MIITQRLFAMMLIKRQNVIGIYLSKMSKTKNGGSNV